MIFLIFLPLEAFINDEVLYIHGGIGPSVKALKVIEKIPRQLEVLLSVTNEEEKLVVDILWSDPPDCDNVIEIHHNTARDPTRVGNIIKFGEHILKSF